jgi:hypothetical protein
LSQEERERVVADPEALREERAENDELKAILLEALSGGRVRDLALWMGALRVMGEEAPEGSGEESTGEGSDPSVTGPSEGSVPGHPA